jgi:hypothetical protein
MRKETGYPRTLDLCIGRAGVCVCDIMDVWVLWLMMAVISFDVVYDSRAAVAPAPQAVIRSM